MEVFRALGVLAEPPQAETERLVDLLRLDRSPTPEEYTELFLFQLYPYGSVYLGTEGMLGGDARDRVAGFWRVLQEPPPPEPDHLAIMLAMYAHLSELEDEAAEVGAAGVGARQHAALRRARAAYLWEHLLSWLPVFLDKVQEIAPSPYRAWGRVLTEVLIQESRRQPLPDSLPLHLRATAPLGENPGSWQDLLDGLLAPVRSGIILTKADLARAARHTGLALRAGERRFSLEALLSQDAEAMLQWMADEATSWVDRHQRRESWLPSISREWARRAAQTGKLLRLGNKDMVGA